MIQLQVFIPNNNLSERQYIIKTLFYDFLGLSYEIVVQNNCDNYLIKFDNRQIVIKDSFFNSYKEPSSYLKEDNIPVTLSWLDMKDYNCINQVPVLYGDNIINIENNKVYCGLDIFASAFFMLTRWEEYVISNKDKFGRCNEDDMFVVKHGIYNRPIVDEYVELLKVLLTRIGVELSTSKKQFSVGLTHDVDYLFRYANFKNFIQNLAGDILNRHSLPTLFRTLYNYMLFKFGKRLDPFDTFDEIMDLSESLGVKSAFYFKAAVNGEYDYTYNIFDKRVVGIMNNIVSRGHEVGIHPSKNTFHNSDQFRLEVERLRSIGLEINGGRQHFLLYDLPYTLRNWNDNGLDYDAGLGFAFRAGFRCGTSHQFNFFDCIERKTLSLKVRPLICMEGALFDYNQEQPLNVIEQEIIKLVNLVYLHKGCFVFLWHNDRFYRPESLKTVSIYKNVLSYISRLLNESR